MTNGNLNFLSELEQILRQRAAADPSESYTATLRQKGQAHIAQKLGEEAVEHRLIDIRKQLDIGDQGVFVGLLGGLVGHPVFADLTVVLDEPRV